MEKSVAPRSTRNGNKPHAVCVPYPIQGHIKPMLKLAKLLHHHGFHITFVNTEFNHSRLSKSNGLASLSGLPDFKFASIPDGLPASDPDVSQDIAALCKSIKTKFLEPFLNLMANLSDDVTCIVSDGFMSDFTVPAAEMLRIPVALLFSINASVFMTTFQFRTLKDKGLVPFIDESYLTNEAYLDTVINWMPGIKEIRIRDLPTFIRTTDQNDFLFHFIMESTERPPKNSPVIFHTFDSLEGDVLGALSSHFSSIHTIGPLDLLLKQLPEDRLGSMAGSLWKEDIECLQWLDGHEPNSVIYVNFGSITVMTPQQMVEFGWGLANSKHPFLWVIRPDLVIGESALLPVEFVEQTRERGMVVSWCPQEKVLNHPSIGGFLTHCGWNSTMESIAAGVPMLCWPFFADQQTNCRFCCKEWEIGIEIDSNADRGGLEKLVRDLMEGEKGKELRRNVTELKKKAVEATSIGGSSAASLEALIKRLLQPIK